MSIYKGNQLIAGAMPDSANQSLSNLNETGEKHFVNKTQITNCILEAPNGVATYSGPYFTVKAGVKVLMPNGRNADGTLSNLEYTLSTDTSFDQAINLSDLAPRYALVRSDGTVISRRLLPDADGVLPATVRDTYPWAIYDKATNYFYSTTGSQTANWSREPVQASVARYGGNDSSDPTKITSFTAYQPISLAKEQDLDGSWTFKFQSLANSQTWAGNTDYKFDLSSYLPNDDNVYEVILNVHCNTPNTVGAYLRITCKTDVMNDNYAYNIGAAKCAVAAQNPPIDSVVIVAVGLKRYLTIRNAVANVTATSSSAHVTGYRKVR